jgi:hypothetical protein
MTLNYQKWGYGGLYGQRTLQRFCFFVQVDDVISNQVAPVSDAPGQEWEYDEY